MACLCVGEIVRFDGGGTGESVLGGNRAFIVRHLRGCFEVAVVLKRLIRGVCACGSTHGMME